MSPAPVAPADDPRGGSIYDLGYRGYEGPRLGRRAAVMALLAHSWRTAYGLGRRTRSKVAPMGLTVIALLPSLVAIGLIALLGQFGEAGEAIETFSPVRYATLFPFAATIVFLFAALQAPELFGRDQKSGTLPLYFSRAITRNDYAVARLLGLLSALLVIVAAPFLLWMVGRVFLAPVLADGLAEELPSLPAVVAVSVVVTLGVGCISGAIAALAPRRLTATVGNVAIFLLPNIAASILVAFETGIVGQIAVLLSPADVLDGVNAFFFGTEPDNIPDAGIEGWAYLAAAAAWITGSLFVIWRRYQDIEA